MADNTEVIRLRARVMELEDCLRMIVSGGYDEAARVHAAKIATKAILADKPKDIVRDAMREE